MAPAKPTNGMPKTVFVGVVQASGTTGFVYDGEGHKVQETFNGNVSKQWVWCGNRPCEERDGLGNVVKRFYSRGEQINGAPYYFTKDHLGSVREVTDSTGAIRARYDYDPYGRMTKVSGDLNADFGFTGDYYDSATGLSLTMYRTYDPNLGRWLSRDPLGENAGTNVYAYVGNNPILETDPMGLCICDTLNQQLTTADAILTANQGYFSPGGQYANSTGLTTDTDVGET